MTSICIPFVKVLQVSKTPLFVTNLSPGIGIRTMFHVFTYVRKTGLNCKYVLCKFLQPEHLLRRLFSVVWFDRLYVVVSTIRSLGKHKHITADFVNSCTTMQQLEPESIVRRTIMQHPTSMAVVI